MMVENDESNGSVKWGWRAIIIFGINYQKCISTMLIIINRSAFDVILYYLRLVKSGTRRAEGQCGQKRSCVDMKK